MAVSSSLLAEMLGFIEITVKIGMDQFQTDDQQQRFHISLTSLTMWNHY